MNGPIPISTDTTFDNVTVTGSGVLTLDATLTVNANMTILPGGVVTHSYYTGRDAVAEAGAECDRDPGCAGAIDVDDRGLRGGSRVNQFDPQGRPTTRRGR